MSEPAPNSELEKLQVQGLEFYARVSLDGTPTATVGPVDEDAAAAWPLILRQATRLGNTFGFDEVNTLRAAIDQRQLYLQQHADGCEGMVAMKKASTTRLLNALGELS